MNTENRTLYEESLKLHQTYQGKIEIASKVDLNTSHDLSLSYTPGVAEVSRQIHRNPQLVNRYTSRGNMVAVITDGSSILGLGNLGAQPAIPVMEGKAILFKLLAGIDAFPLCLDTQNIDEIVATIKHISPIFAGINLEDIGAPRCFEIEQRLREALNIPVFHDDQHGTAVVVIAALLNALRITGKTIEDVNIVINGAGAAGTAIAKLALSMNANNITICDREGIIHKQRENLNPHKQELAELTNKQQLTGSLKDAMRGADVFIGVSRGNLVNREMVKSMNKDPIIFALANPTPEIMPEEAKAAGARIVATGRSDYPNQVNNVLGFPGIFRGTLDTQAVDINEEMKKAAIKALADVIRPEELSEDYIIPHPLNPEVVPRVAAAVAKAAESSGVAKTHPTPTEVIQHYHELTDI
jgi:malate dehydrogenase (oxaloacetate-decarboxylating)